MLKKNVSEYLFLAFLEDVPYFLAPFSSLVRFWTLVPTIFADAKEMIDSKYKRLLKNV